MDSAAAACGLALEKMSDDVVLADAANVLETDPSQAQAYVVCVFHSHLHPGSLDPVSHPFLIFCISVVNVDIIL
jgi:hypothetical protein